MYRPTFSHRLAVAVIAVASYSAHAKDREINVTSDIPYQTGEGLDAYQTERCKLDLYVPADAKNLPCIVWFHGGGLTGGDKANDKSVAVCRAMAAEGWIVAAVNYRLSPRAKFPAYVEDSAASVGWVATRAKEFGADPARVYVAGHSAGGYLAAMVALDESYLLKHRLTPEQIAGVIPIAGQMMTHYTIREERGLPKDRVIVDAAAPINHARKHTPPFLLLYAENDMALRGDENRYFAAALHAAGNRQVTLREIAGHDHSGIGDRIAEPESPVRRAIAEFIRTTGAAGSPQTKK